MFKNGVIGAAPIVVRRLVGSRFRAAVPAVLNARGRGRSKTSDATGVSQAQISAVATHLADEYLQGLVRAVTPNRGRFGQLQSARFWHTLLAGVALTSPTLAAPAWVLGAAWPREELLLNVWPPLLVCATHARGGAWRPALHQLALPAVALSYLLGTALFEVHAPVARATLALANLVHIALLRCGAPGYLDIYRSRVPACSLFGHAAWYMATLVPGMHAGSHEE